MGAISGANPIVASDINNFTGELFKITPHRTSTGNSRWIERRKCYQ